MSGSPAATGAPGAALKVRVTVRSIVGQVPCAGHVFTPDPVVLDAAPADVRDMLNAAGSLFIDWPEGYTLPNGLQPGKATLKPSAVPDTLTSSDIVAIAERQAADAVERANAAAHAMLAMRSDHAGEIAAMGREIAELKARLADVTGAVNATEVTASADAQALAEAEREHAMVVDAMKAQHAAALDTERAEHAAELETLAMENARLQVDVERLQAALDAVKPKGKGKGGATPPAPEPADPTAP